MSYLGVWYTLLALNHHVRALDLKLAIYDQGWIEVWCLFVIIWSEKRKHVELNVMTSSRPSFTAKVSTCTVCLEMSDNGSSGFMNLYIKLYIEIFVMTRRIQWWWLYNIIFVSCYITHQFLFLDSLIKKINVFTFKVPFTLF